MFSILTCTRSKAARWIHQSDIDYTNGVYTIQEKNDKGKHRPESQRRIFLARPVIQWLKTMPQYAGGYLFPSSKTYRPIDENSPRQFIIKIHKKMFALDGVGWVDPLTKDENGNPQMIRNCAK